MSKAIVIGAGSAGPAVAQLLTAHGWEAPVFEARPTLDTTEGLFLNLAVNGRRVLELLGANSAILADAHPAGLSQMYGAKGQLLGAVPNGPAGRPADGGVIVRRGRLQQVLWQAAMDAGVRIHLGKSLTGLDESGDGVVAHFADGHVEAGDIVIGADGVGSAVRRHISPEVVAEFSGLVGTGGFAAVPGLAPTPGVQRFVFGRRSFFGYLVRDDGTVYWFANLSATSPPSRDERVHDGALLDRLRTLHANDADPVPRILATAEGPIGCYPIFRLPRLPHWSRGRAVVIGDAVHATSPSAGQGASLALEDAACLASSLIDQDDHRAAFLAFENDRRVRVERIVAYAAGIDRAKRTSGGRVTAAMRDALLPLFLRRAAQDTRYDWVFEWTPLPLTR